MWRNTRPLFIAQNQAIQGFLHFGSRESPQPCAELAPPRKCQHTLIHKEEKRLVASGAVPDEGPYHVAQEGLFEMVKLSYFLRLARIRQFQDVLAKESGSTGA